MNAGGFGPLAEWLEEHTGFRDVFLGADVYVEQHGRPVFEYVSGVDAEGVAMRERPLGLVRCAVAKPLLLLAIATLVQEGVVDIDAPVGRYLRNPAHPEIAALPMWTLLAHKAGVHNLTGLILTLFEPERQREMVRMTPPAPGFGIGEDFAYSEAAAAVLLTEVLETMTGVEYQDYYRTHVMAPEGFDAHVIMRFDDDSFRTSSDLIGVNGNVDADPVIPYLIDRAPTFAKEWNPGWGGYASARGIAATYRWMLDVWSGRHASSALAPETFDAMFTPRFVIDDPTGESPAGVEQTNMGSYGFHHGFAAYGVPVSQRPHTLGHGGWGVAMGIADRDLDLVIAMRFIGHTDVTAHKRLRCARVVEGVYGALGLA